jgi:hypothetical protein
MCVCVQWRGERLTFFGRMELIKGSKHPPSVRYLIFANFAKAMPFTARSLDLISFCVALNSFASCLGFSASSAALSSMMKGSAGRVNKPTDTPMHDARL